MRACWQALLRNHLLVLHTPHDPPAAFAADHSISHNCTAIGGVPVLPPALLPTRTPATMPSSVQALLLTFLEEHLYAGEVEEGWVEAYPAYLVVLTSGLGVLLASRLAEAKTIGRTTTWLLQCMFAAKLAMLLLPEVSFEPSGIYLLSACSYLAGAQLYLKLVGASTCKHSPTGQHDCL